MNNHIEVLLPLSNLILPIHYYHDIANSPEYYSAGRLRQSETHCIFHYTLKGRGECWYNGRYHSLHPGQGFLHIINDINAGYRYPPDGKDEWEFICLCFKGAPCSNAVREMIDTYGVVYSLQQASKFVQRITFYEFWKKPVSIYCSEGIQIITELFTALLESKESSRIHENLSGNLLIDRTKLLIREKITQNVNASEIAINLGVSREYLSRRFKEYTKKSISDYIKEEKITYICSLLKDKSTAVKMVAETMNYSSDSNFSRMFKSVMGMTPGEFRKYGNIPIF